MNIKPSTTIRQDYNGFSKYCHDLDEPVVLTRNGEADLIVMSHEAFRRREARIHLQSKLLVAEKQIAECEPLLEHDQVMARMRRKINATKEEKKANSFQQAETSRNQMESRLHLIGSSHLRFD